MTHNAEGMKSHFGVLPHRHRLTGSDKKTYNSDHIGTSPDDNFYYASFGGFRPANTQHATLFGIFINAVIQQPIELASYEIS